MKFEKLNEMIPYAKGGKVKILEMHPYNAITLRMPGRHATDTVPVGGDFVVCVDDDTLDWTEHQFTHADLFADMEYKNLNGPKHINTAQDLMRQYLRVVQGDEPTRDAWIENYFGASLHPQTFLYAVQCLAVAEHRRYPQHEAKFGGRFLPFRAAAGIAEGLWSATEAADRTRTRGRIGVEWLEKDYGVPTLTQDLMGIDISAPV